MFLLNFSGLRLRVFGVSQRMPKRILVVDDDAQVIGLLTLGLENAGYEVHSAEGGEEGLRKARAVRPDLMILDINMPVMNGYQVCEKVRADGGLSGLKILMTSAKSYSADIKTARNAGADSYLVKPFALAQLLDAVKSLLSPRMTAPSMTVRFWGARGSIATPGPRTQRYGGNTSCVELRHGDGLYIMDAGTGMRMLGDRLTAQAKGDPVAGHIFITHTHWDHIQGFPFFAPAYVSGNRFTVHGTRGAAKSFETLFRGLMDPHYFPVEMGDMAAELRFIELSGESVEYGGMRVQTVFTNHPGMAIAYRFNADGRSVTYLTDHESFGALKDSGAFSRRQDQMIEDFCRGTDLLICDSQYTDEEYRSKRGWGHNPYRASVRLALEAGAKKLALFHHDPSHSDEAMDAIVEDAAEIVKKSGKPLDCFAAVEGRQLTL